MPITTNPIQSALLADCSDAIDLSEVDPIMGIQSTGEPDFMRDSNLCEVHENVLADQDDDKDLAIELSRQWSEPPERYVSPEEAAIDAPTFEEIKCEFEESFAVISECFPGSNEETQVAYRKFMAGLFDDCDAFPNTSAETDKQDAELALKVQTRLRPDHLADLKKSGLSNANIFAMGCESKTAYEIHKAVYGNSDMSSKWNAIHGYSIPYRDAAGNVVLTRFRIFSNKCDMEDREQLPKYMSPLGAKTCLYLPPGFASVFDATDYLIITEGEKKAAKAVQEGLPCAALAGIDMWADSDIRKVEKANHLGMSYSTQLLPMLSKLSDRRKVIVLFDSDAESKKQIKDSRRRLKDALLFQSTDWCRTMAMPVPKGKETQKLGIDDLLAAGEMRFFDEKLKSELTLPTNQMTNLFRLPYMQKYGKVYSYYVPNQGRYEKYAQIGVMKEIPGEEGGCEVKEICSASVWLSRVIHSIDGEGDTLYELTFVPHSEKLPRTITGDSELIQISNSKDDVLARKGTMVLPKHRAAMQEFLVDCQKYGVNEGRVKKAYGSRRRGWRDADEYLDHASYVMASRIITEKEVFSADHPDNTLLPIDSGSDDALRQALTVRGDFSVWKNAMQEHVLFSPIPCLVLGAGFAGLFRHWCDGSENFILHLYGESSAGKTTAVKAAASAWGNPKRLIDTWRATTNGLERKAVGRNDMVLFLDEAGMAEEQELVDAIYALGNGGEKMRATKDARERTTTKYNVVALSTGEKQLVRGSKFAGQEARALELRVDVAGPFWRTIENVQQAEEFSRVLDENYGHAIEPMIRGMLCKRGSNKKYLAELFQSRTDVIRGMVSSDQLPQHTIRRIKHFGICLAALDLFLESVMQWSREEIEDRMDDLSETIVRCMVQLDTDQFKKGEEVGILQHFVNQLSSCQSRFIIEGKHAPIPHDLIGSIEGKLVYCIPSKLSEMMRPYDNARLIQVAVKFGVLRTREGSARGAVRKTISHRLGGANPDCYLFDMAKIEKILYSDE